MPLSAIADRSRAPRSRRIRARSGCAGRSSPAGSSVSAAPISASRPRNVFTLVLTILTASSGPTASTTLASDCSE